MRIVLVLFTLAIFSGTSYADEIKQLKNIGKAFTSVAKKSSPMVVFIQTEAEVDRGTGHYRDHFFFPETPGRKQIGQGSGFVISSDGHIVTNNHVVAGASRVKVTFLDGKSVTATVLGTDKHTDIALIKVELKDLPFMSFADSNEVEVGEWVIALGNPFGLSHSLTAGIVSAMGRNSVGIANYENFIQTDAAINPGNSGGPLINLEGEAVGMNTAIFSRSGGYMGIGFAIPANMVKSVVAQLKDRGSVVRGFLGVSIHDIDSELAKKYRLTQTSGIFVSDVGPGTPAQVAGVKSGDIILKFNKESISSSAVFRNKIASMAPDSKNEIEILRGSEKKKVPVVLGQLPKQITRVRATQGRQFDYGR